MESTAVICVLAALLKQSLKGEKMNVMDVFESLKQVAMIFTLTYMWIAACLYLAYNVNVAPANACFYGGVSVMILGLITSPRFKKTKV